MPGLLFSGVNLATVAYGEIDGPTGSSTRMNSGVTTTRLAAGQYAIILPTGLAQTDARDIFIVQPKLDPVSSPPGLVAFAMIDDTNDTTKLVNLYSGNPAAAAVTTVDVSFTFIILRTTTTPPLNSPA